MNNDLVNLNNLILTKYICIKTIWNDLIEEIKYIKIFNNIGTVIFTALKM